VVSPPAIFELSFLEVSDFTVESIFVTELESAFKESALPPVLLPLQAPSDNDIARAINGSLKLFSMVLIISELYRKNKEIE
jgi:hypothetical protein